MNQLIFRSRSQLELSAGLELFIPAYFFFSAICSPPANNVGERTELERR
jgi:hypothetical protein